MWKKNQGMFLAFRYVLKCSSAQSEGTSRKEHEMRRQHTESPYLYKYFWNRRGLPRCSHGLTFGSSADLKRYLQEIGTGEETLNLPKGPSEWEEADAFFQGSFDSQSVQRRDSWGHEHCLVQWYLWVHCLQEPKQNTTTLTPYSTQSMPPKDQRQTPKDPKALKEEKKQAKKQLRALWRDGT